MELGHREMRKEMKGQRDDINGLGPQNVICMFLLFWGGFYIHDIASGLFRAALLPEKHLKMH